MGQTSDVPEFEFYRSWSINGLWNNPQETATRTSVFPAPTALLIFHLSKKGGMGAMDQQMAAGSKSHVTSQDHSR